MMPEISTELPSARMARSSWPAQRLPTSLSMLSRFSFCFSSRLSPEERLATGRAIFSDDLRKPLDRRNCPNSGMWSSTLVTSDCRADAKWPRLKSSILLRLTSAGRCTWVSGSASGGEATAVREANALRDGFASSAASLSARRLCMNERVDASAPPAPKLVRPSHPGLRGSGPTRIGSRRCSLQCGILVSGCDGGGCGDGVGGACSPYEASCDSSSHKPSSHCHPSACGCGETCCRRRLCFSDRTRCNDVHTILGDAGSSSRTCSTEVGMISPCADSRATSGSATTSRGKFRNAEASTKPVPCVSSLWNNSLSRSSLSSCSESLRLQRKILFTFASVKVLCRVAGTRKSRSESCPLGSRHILLIRSVRQGPTSCQHSQSLTGFGLWLRLETRFEDRGCESRLDLVVPDEARPD
mmetsp:Transcript_45096/g.125015  ORF Transcript_45096/g.125015 Transcript_45096/m.125015 type:complete len:413 (+) Transcript_45096:215-1453(+)